MNAVVHHFVEPLGADIEVKAAVEHIGHGGRYRRMTVLAVVPANRRRSQSEFGSFGNFIGREFAGMNRALIQKPGHHLHQSGRQPERLAAQ